MRARFTTATQSSSDSGHTTKSTARWRLAVKHPRHLVGRGLAVAVDQPLAVVGAELVGPQRGRQCCEEASLRWTGET